MNKQELINEYEKRLQEYNSVEIYHIYREFIIDLTELEQPKVKVPQYIADKIEYCKKSDGYNLFHAIDYSYNFKECASWLELKDNTETFARAWLDGYEVEKEKRYTVTVKGDIKEKLLVYGKTVKRYFFTKYYDLYNVIYSHTRKQLEEAGFGWVFDCPGIEIEEVQDDTKI